MFFSCFGNWGAMLNHTPAKLLQLEPYGFGT